MLDGLLLGDAHAQHKPTCRNASIHFLQTLKQKAFVDHLFQTFAAYTHMPTPRVTWNRYRVQGVEKMKPSYAFETFIHPQFTQFHTRHYTRDASGRRKVIPADVASWLTPRVLAYQIMCDGSMDRKSMTIATHGYTAEDCHRYVQAVNSLYGLHGKVVPQKQGGVIYARLRFPVKDLPTFQTLLGPFILPCFRYKIGIGTFTDARAALAARSDDEGGGSDADNSCVT